MPRLQPVEPGMLQEIHDHLLTSLDADRGEDQWRSIFDYPWRRPGTPRGYCLFEGSEPVAFMGMILAERTIDGRPRSFCNITSWIAKAPYQSESALLVLQLRRLRDHTITNLTANQNAAQVFSRLGFEILDTHRTLIYAGTLAARSRLRCELSARHGFDSLEAVLSDTDRQVLEDHRSVVFHALAWNQETYCYICYTLGRRRALPTVRIHYISDLDAFVDGLPALQRQWLRAHGATIAECDSRLLSERRLPFSRRVPLPTPRMVRGAVHPPRQIDNLYSEIVLLNLT